jgi:hypothetical protein
MEYYALGVLCGVIFAPLASSLVEFLSLVLERMKLFPLKHIDKYNKPNAVEEKKDTMGFK